MDYQGYTTFKEETKEAVLSVTIDYPSVNVQGIPMLDDLDELAEALESDRNIRVVVSSPPFREYMDTDHVKQMFIYDQQQLDSCI